MENESQEEWEKNNAELSAIKQTTNTLLKQLSLWRARSRLYRSRFLQAHTHSARCVWDLKHLRTSAPFQTKQHSSWKNRNGQTYGRKTPGEEKQQSQKKSRKSVKNGQKPAKMWLR